MFSHEMMTGRLVSTMFMVCHSTSFSCAPAILPAHKIHPVALSKCPNHPPFSQFLTHFTEVWAALSPAGYWHSMATFACPETTLWPNCGVFVEQGQCTLEASCNFWLEVKNMRKPWVCKEPREDRGFSHNVTHVHNPDSFFSGSNRMIFWRSLAPRESNKLPTINRQLLDKFSNILLTQIPTSGIRRSQNILTWNLCWDVDRWGLCF